MKNRVIRLLIFAFPVVVLILSPGCSKTKDTEAEEQQLIQNYITAKGDTEKPNADGMYIIPVARGTGDTARNNDWILFNYDAYFLESGKLFDSTDTTLARTNQITPQYILGGPVKGILQGSHSWLEGFLSMREGGKATFIIPSKLWNYDQQPRILNVTLVRVIPDLREYEISQIDTLIHEINLAYTLHVTSADSSQGPISGIYYLETQAGTGASPLSPDSVNISYTMELMDGRIIQQVQNQNYVLGQAYDPPAPAFEQVIEQMKAGSSGYMIIPYHDGISNWVIEDANKNIMVQGYSTIVYQITLNTVY